MPSDVKAYKNPCSYTAMRNNFTVVWNIILLFYADFIVYRCFKRLHKSGLHRPYTTAPDRINNSNIMPKTLFVTTFSLHVPDIVPYRHTKERPLASNILAKKAIAKNAPTPPTVTVHNSFFKRRRRRPTVRFYNNNIRYVLYYYYYYIRCRVHTLCTRIAYNIQYTYIIITLKIILF